MLRAGGAVTAAAARRERCSVVACGGSQQVHALWSARGRGNVWGAKQGFTGRKLADSVRESAKGSAVVRYKKYDTAERSVVPWLFCVYELYRRDPPQSKPVSQGKPSVTQRHTRELKNLKGDVGLPGNANNMQG